MRGTEMTTKEIFNEMQKRMDANPAKLAGIKAVFQFDISEADPGLYSVAMADGKAVVSEGAYASPDITITMVSNDFADMVEGRLDGITAFMGGKLKVKGDMMLAMQLQSLLK
jgi:putative sterol carrier protein